MNRKKQLLSLLLIALAGSLIYSYLRFPKERRVATLTYRPGAVASAPRKSTLPRPKTGAPPAALPGVPQAAQPAAPQAAQPGAPQAARPAAPEAARPAAPEAARPAAPQAAQPGASRGGAAASGGGESRVELALLEQAPGRFTGYRRNIFAPLFHEEVKLPPFRPPPPRPVSKALPVPPPPSGPPVPPPPPPPPSAEQLADAELAKLSFLGFLKKNGERTVFLAYDSEIMLAKKGATLGSKFYVSELTDDAITVKALSASREIVIPLVESRGLATRQRKRNP